MNSKVEWIKVILFHLLVTIGVALSAVGASGLQSGDPSPTDSTFMKVGSAILTTAWVILSVWTIVSIWSSTRLRKTSHESMGCVVRNE